ncbi:hypothetical protein SAMN04489742_0272 [Arthrobacter crystallopoietes]|uniref:Uncharacterized protein n=2 Tax=Crystallibacter crystallopoietes TaxID=37928 RepID=A0A1H0ZDI4_9MICC|nr:hypothetical protein SAMN04489742_0272 [Arthrobacter crystallopoietes]
MLRTDEPVATRPSDSTLELGEFLGDHGDCLVQEIQTLLAELEGKVTRYTWLKSSQETPKEQRAENMRSLAFMQTALEDITATVVGISVSSQSDPGMETTGRISSCG